MFDHLGTCQAPVSADRVRGWVAALASATGPADEPGGLDLLTALEELKGAAEGLQADLAVDVDASRRRQEAEAGVPESRRGRGVAAEIGLARRVRPIVGSSSWVWARCCAPRCRTLGRSSVRAAPASGG